MKNNTKGYWNWNQKQTNMMYKKQIIKIAITIILVIPSVIVQAQDLTNGLISAWEFEETSGLTVEDAHGGNHGNNTGALVNQVNSINDLGNCFEFRNSDNRVEVNYTEDLFSNEYSISFWINSDISDYSSNGYCVAMYDYASDKRSWAIRIGSSSDKFELVTSADGTNSNIGVCTLNRPIETGWHHLVVIIDNTNNKVSLYYDGVLIEMLSFAVNYTNQSTDLLLGGLKGSSAIDAKLDQPAIWNRALTAAEVSQLFNSGNGLAYDDWDQQPTGTADNLGNHTATQNIKLNGKWLSNDGGSEGIRVDNSGNIGINTTEIDGYDLAVGGKIHAEEVVVETGWADFVFKPNYQLKTLPEVEQFIKTNGHLPDIPSEAEVNQNGISVGEINSKLLQKIEELTLYVIQQQKEIEKLKREREMCNQ